MCRKFAIMRGHVQVFGCPVGGQRAEFVADIEAHVVALFEHDQLGWTRGRARQALPLADRDHLSPAPKTTSSGHLIRCATPSSVKPRAMSRASATVLA